MHYMSPKFTFILIAIFSVFLGSQITEGVLLVPYWKSLSSIKFYEYYTNFGVVINRFYTILTIIAVLIPLYLTLYCYFNNIRALKSAIISSVFALLIIVLFFIYFKGVNQQFFEATFGANKLKSVLKYWEYMHWLRVFVEFISLIFLIKTFNLLIDNSVKTSKTN